MRLGHRLLGDRHGYADDHSGGLIHRARCYETCAGLFFLGQRRRVYDGLVALSGARSGDRVLDVGCGTGYFTRRTARAVAPEGTVIGIDPSPSVIDYASSHSPANCSYHLAGAAALPYNDASFDRVQSTLALHHIPPPQRPIALREMHRVLRPGGTLLIADFRPPRNRLANRAIGALAGHAMQHNPIDQLADLITAAGFDITAQGDRWPLLHYVQARHGSAP